MDVQFNRRNLLAAAAAAIASASMGATARGLRRPAQAPAAPPASERAWRQLRQELGGALLRPGDAPYRAAALPNNLRYAGAHPAGIARCRGADDVGAAIRWCREHRVPLIARAGGHSYAGFSTTAGLLIDVRAMRRTVYDPATQEVHIAGGALNSDVYAALRRVGRAITHGRCPSVGAAAFVLGGGIGFNMRNDGLACDALISTDLVLANGTRTTVGPAGSVGDRDLYWACRGGGGGNFGINTGFTLKTFAAEPVTVFSMLWRDASVELGDALMQALRAGPDKLGSRISFQAAGGRVNIDLIGQLRGSLRDLMDVLAPVYRLAKPSEARIDAEVDYWVGQDFLHEEGAPTYYQERSAYVRDRFPGDALASGFEFLRRAPRVGGTRDLRFFQTGGAINDVAPGATAFVHRDNQWLMVVGLYWTAADNRDELLMHRAHAWQDRFYQTMLHYTDGGSYQNFADPSLVDWRAAYYGANYDRLRRIKKAVDPDQVFDFAQAV